MTSDNPNGWNFRVVRLVGTVEQFDMEMDYYEVHEVYYTNDVPDSMSDKFSAPGGETIKEFEFSWKLYMKALQRPVLLWNINEKRFTGDEEPAIGKL